MNKSNILAPLKKDHSNQTDTDIRSLLSKERLRKNKKRVVSTLFLCLLLFVMACDFETLEEWVSPGWYFDLTLPLINMEYSFAELLSDSTIYSDSLLGVIDSVLHVSYPVTLDTSGLPDEVFNLDMGYSVVPENEMDIGESITIPAIPSQSMSIDIPINNLDIQDGVDCFPELLIDNITVPPIEDTFSIDFPNGNNFIELKEIILLYGNWNIQVTNDLPFPVSITEFSITNVTDNVTDTLIDVGTALENIMPYTTGDTSIAITEGIKISDFFTYSVLTNIGGETNSPDCFGGDGWEIRENVTPALSLTFGYEFGPIDSVIIYTSGIDTIIPMTTVIPNFNGLGILKATFANSTGAYPNVLKLVINNDFFLDYQLGLEFPNIFSDSIDEVNGTIIWENLRDTIYVDAESSKEKTISFSKKTLTKVHPNSVSEEINSIVINLNPILSEGLYTIEVENGTITATGPKINSVGLGKISLEYIEAIAHNLQIDSEPSPSMEGIPDGFSNIEFMDFIMKLELFNEISIPTEIFLNLWGTKESEEGDTVKITAEIGSPIGTLYGCDFVNGDIARTIITMNKNTKITEYYCTPMDSEPISTITSSNTSSLVELLNFAPERINVNGYIKIDGEGILTKGSEIWGTINLDSPLSFKFKSPIIIIPEESDSLSPINSETAEEINSSLIDGEFFVDITNRSPAKGSLSLLISDSTIFPPFLDSLGIWSIDEDTIKNTFPGITSISFTATDPETNSKALEVKFYKDDILQFFIGRIFDLEFPAADSIDYEFGYAIPTFPGIYTSSVKIDTSVLGWLITDQPRYVNAMITFDHSPIQDIMENDTIYTPITLQTTNAVEVQAYLTLKLDTDGSVSRKQP